MKKLMTILAGALAIAWIAVPVAGAADVYGATHPNPYDSVGLRPAVDKLKHPSPRHRREPVTTTCARANTTPRAGALASPCSPWQPCGQRNSGAFPFRRPKP